MSGGSPFRPTPLDGITHDFTMLNPLSDAHARRAAVAQTIATPRQALHPR
jgi:acetyl esterase